jgi:predicted nucleotidyltransferase component of viral defense system
MLDRTQLEKYGPVGFNLGQKEKDYIQHWMLSFIFQSGFSGVFKGGTCLQKAFNLPRFSEDLDFTLNEPQTPDENEAKKFMDMAGFNVVELSKKEGEFSENWKIRIQGPLYIPGKKLSEVSLTLDFSKREKIILKPQIKTIKPQYPDLLPYTVKTMDLNEMCAEKIRAVMTRNSARDLFDLYFLLRNPSIPSREMINEKLKLYSREFESKVFKKQVKSLEKLWKGEMQALTPNYLDYTLVAKEVIKMTEKI